MMKPDIQNIDTVIEFLQTQKKAIKRQEEEIEAERLELQRELERLESQLGRELSRGRELRQRFRESKAGGSGEAGPVKEVAGQSSGGVRAKHQRTRSDYRQKESKEKAPRHARKKSHQDFPGKAEAEIPSHIKKNIKSLIASRIHTETQPAGKPTRWSDINIRKVNSRTSSKTPSNPQVRRANFRRPDRRDSGDAEEAAAPCPRGWSEPGSPTATRLRAVGPAEQVEAVCAFEPHQGRLHCAKFFGRQGFEQYCLTAGADGAVKVWHFPQLLNADVDVKKPAAVCPCGPGQPTALEAFGSFMGLPVFGAGTSEGSVSLCAIYPASRHRDMAIGSWTAHPHAPVRQLAALPDLQLLASLAGGAAKVWSYKIADEGVRADMRLALDTPMLQKLSAATSPAWLGWLGASCHLGLLFADASHVDCFDVETGSLARRMAVGRIPKRSVEETLPRRYCRLSRFAFLASLSVTVLGCQDGSLRWVDYRANQTICVSSHAAVPITSLSVAADDRVLSVGSADKAVSLWDVRRMEHLLALPTLSAGCSLEMGHGVLAACRLS